MLDQAFAALKQFDWGTDLAAVAPIDDAVVGLHGKTEALGELETQLAAALKTEISRDAKDYLCRKLAIIGTARSVPTLAALVTEKDHSHMARFALERMPAPEAGQALRDALPKASADLKVGVISSLGARRDAESIASLQSLLSDKEASVSRAAAIALGNIGSDKATDALKTGLSSAKETKQYVMDALLSCAESLLAAKKRAEALAIYKSLAKDEQPRLVRLAATRGILACADKVG